MISNHSNLKKSLEASNQPSKTTLQHFLQICKYIYNSKGQHRQQCKMQTIMPDQNNSTTSLHPNKDAALRLQHRCQSRLHTNRDASPQWRHHTKGKMWCIGATSADSAWCMSYRVLIFLLGLSGECMIYTVLVFLLGKI
jgi:hypothetical protein